MTYCVVSINRPPASIGGAMNKRLAAACVALLVSVTVSASAQTDIYRCTVNGKIKFSDEPCPATATKSAKIASHASSEGTAQTTGSDGSMAQRIEEERRVSANALAGYEANCRKGMPYACDTAASLRGVIKEHADRDAACAAGDQKACAQQACYLKDDGRACSVALGFPAGKSWHLVSENESRVRDASDIGVYYRVIEHVIVCESQTANVQKSAYAVLNSPRDKKGFPAPAAQRFTLTEPDSQHLIVGPFFESLDEAADAACAAGRSR
jgi:hypothetical protein